MANIDFQFSSILDWTRRAIGDTAQRVRETQVSDGTDTIVLNNTGTITLLSISVDQVAVDTDQVTQDVNVLVFAEALTNGATVVVTYTQTTYSDDEVQAFLADAAREVGGDLDLDWEVDDNNEWIYEIPDDWADGRDELVADVRGLLVLKTALVVADSKGARAADEAILIKDGDTTIDTSKAAGAQDRATQRRSKRYDQQVRNVLVKRFAGHYDTTRSRAGLEQDSTGDTST